MLCSVVVSVVVTAVCRSNCCSKGSSTSRSSSGIHGEISHKHEVLSLEDYRIRFIASDAARRPYRRPSRANLPARSRCLHLAI